MAPVDSGKRERIMIMIMIMIKNGGVSREDVNGEAKLHCLNGLLSHIATVVSILVVPDLLEQVLVVPVLVGFRVVTR